MSIFARVMGFFKEHLTELPVSVIKDVMKIYRSNSQCTNRARHSEDISIIKKYITEHEEQNEECVEDISNGVAFE